MKTTLVLAATMSMFAFACDKGSSSGATGTTTASSAAASSAPAAPAAKAAEPDCEKVVEKIASLNPPDMRGEPEKKLWRGMCGQMKPEEKTCVMGAANMDAMKACMKK